jgi:gas vesicle protein
MLVGNSQDTGRQALLKEDLSLDKIFSEEERKHLKDQTEELLLRSNEEMLNRTEEGLSRLSNEKIMAVSEFSDQILEKISRNHEEVVFLYNMLNDKEKDIKDTVREIDRVQRKVKEIKSSAEKNETVAPSEPKPLVKPAATPSNASIETDMAENKTANNNKKILSLYSEGRSIVEISKLLDLGQGEVKLVIDLFYGKK